MIFIFFGYVICVWVWAQFFIFLLGLGVDTFLFKFKNVYASLSFFFWKNCQKATLIQFSSKKSNFGYF